MHLQIKNPKNAGLTYISKPITKETNMTKNKVPTDKVDLYTWITCPNECDYSDIKNGECECYNQKTAILEEKAPC